MIRDSRAVLLAAALSILAACGDGTAPKTAAVTVDTLLADINEGLEQVAPAIEMAGGTFIASAPISASACPYTSSSQSFVCPSTTIGGLTYVRSYQLLDAAGVPQAAYSPTTTAAIRTTSDVSGTLSDAGPPPSTTTITSHDTQTLSGLLTANRVLNGTGTMTATFASGPVSSSWTMNTANTDIVLPARGSVSHYPQSGSTSVEFSMAGGAFTVSATLTFNGTSIATLVTTTNGVTETCTIDLSNPGSGPTCP